MITILKVDFSPEIKDLHEEIFGNEINGKRISEEQANGNIDVYILTHNNKHVGYGIVKKNKALLSYHIWLGGVLPDYQKKGIFGFFLNEIKKFAANYQYKFISASSYNHRPKMLTLFIKRGFKISGTSIGTYGDKIKINFRYDVPNKNDVRISLTNKCNFNCFFCHKEGLDVNNFNELSIINLEKILYQADLNNYRSITFTGGEPLITRPALKFAINFCNQLQNKPNLTIVTNGSFLDIDFIKTLQEYEGNIRLNISLHSVLKETFYKITNRANPYTNVLNNLDLLVKNDINFRINYVISVRICQFRF